MIEKTNSAVLGIGMLDPQDAEKRKAYYSFSIDGIMTHNPDIGNATNNEAEYISLMNALISIRTEDDRDTSLIIKMDSALVVNQVNGKWKIGTKNPNIRKLWIGTRNHLSMFGSWTLIWIPRAEIQSELGH